MKRIIASCFAGAACIATATAAATLSSPPDLPQSYLFTSAGKLTPLKAGVTYRASQFPFPITVRPPGSGWSGAQWKSGSEYFRGGGPPHYGWVHLARGSVTTVPRGLISIMSAYARTPTVAQTVNTLRTRGHGASYGETSTITLAGNAGVQFDGRITGAKNVDHIGHYFVPFSPRSHKAKYYPDEYGVYGDVFRVIVLGVHGRTVVIYIENGADPQDNFQTFLDAATKLLATVRFPRGR
jgi:hypothetical protein